MRVEEVRDPGMKAPLYDTGKKLGKHNRMPDCEMPEMCPGRGS